MLLDLSQHPFYIARMNLGARLKLAREIRKMTQEELAEKASTPAMPISQAMISALEKRDSETSMGLFAFAKVLKVSPEWLQTGVGESGLVTAPLLKHKPLSSTLAGNKSAAPDAKVKRRTG